MGIGYISPKLQSMIDNAKLKASHAMAPGILEVGNVNLIDRPKLATPDKGYQTVFTMTAGLDGGKTALLPRVIEGIMHTPEEAMQHFKDTGEHMGIFNSREAADAFDKQLHEDMGWLGARNKWSDQSDSKTD